MSLRLADLGAPIAVGRSAEVFAWHTAGPAAGPDLPADLVVKLFAEGYAPELVDAEEAACAEVQRIGLSGIRCHGQVRVESRSGLLLDRIHGDSLTRLSERNPLRLRENSRVLAREHIRMHESRTDRLPEVRETTLAALDTAPLGFLTAAERHRAEELIRALPAGDRVLHLDYHPENVFAHDGAYTSIDWQTALRGDLTLGLADVEHAYGGLRPLTEAAGEDTYNASRASEVVDHAEHGVEGLLTAAGGKYTTSRAFAEQLMPLVADGELLAQVAVAVRHESARTLTDVLLRRTGIGTLGLPSDDVLEAVAGVAARELGWSGERRDAELAQAHQALALPW